MKSSLFDSVDKVFRYFVPGVIFWLLFWFSYPCYFNVLLKKIENMEVFGYIIVLVTGMIIFGVYRLIFYIVEFFLCCNLITPASIYYQKDKGNSRWDSFSKAQSKFYLLRQGKEFSGNLPDYLHLRWAIVHYTLLFSILLLLFVILFILDLENNYLREYFLGEKPHLKSLVALILFNLSLFGASIFNIASLYSIEKEIVKKKLENGNTNHSQ
jgi:hypothetical protein